MQQSTEPVWLVSRANSLREKVYLEAPFKLHMGYHKKELIPSPPEGYQFVATGGRGEEISSEISKHEFGIRALEALNYNVPLIYLKSEFDRLLRRPPIGTRLTYSCHHLILRQEPWVLESQGIREMVGSNLTQFWALRRRVRDALLSRNCKKVMFFTNFARESCARIFKDSTELMPKLDVLPRAVHAKSVSKIAHEGVNVLFVGSANLSGLFEYRGGREVLEVFSRVSRYRENVTLILRSEVPRHLRARYSELFRSGKVKYYPEPIPAQGLEALYRESDIFFFPSHYESWQIALEAMSYEMPVIALNIEGMSEVIESGVTGYLVSESPSVPTSWNGIPLPTIAPDVKKAISRGPYHDQVVELENRLVRLIDDIELRKSMGTMARASIETGSHSIEFRNRKLKSVFDYAMEHV